MILFSLGSSDIAPADSINNFLRGIFSVLDIIAFFLLTFVFQLFFNVSTVDIFSNETILTFYYRIQVILGVFMMFQLAMTIIKGIVDPDSFNDKKTGAASLIRRIAIALILLVLLVPIRYNNPSNEYEKQLNNNGILFGTLYSLQYRIIQGNVIGKLVLGEDADNENYLENQEALKSESYKFASSVLRVFYRINLNDNDGSLENDDDWMCREWPEGTYELYTQEDANPVQLISLVNMSCDDDGTGKKWYQSLPFLKGATRYHIAYMPIIPAVVGLLLAALILSFSIDVGIRAIKLGFLKLLAPIPIISYMDPKGSKDSAFNSWVKQLTSTYIDLFVRLVLIYFILSIVKEIQEHGFVVGNGAEVDGIMAGLTKIIIFIALFLFAKQAPKFFKSLFGIKDDGDGFGGLFKSLGTAVGLGAAGLGAIGSFNANRIASREADIANGKNADSLPNRAKHIASGILGGIGGGLAGVGAAMTAKDHPVRTALDAQRKRNAQVIGRGTSGSTALGRAESTMRNILTGEGQAAATDREIENNKARIDALKAVKSRVSGEMVKQDWTRGNLGIAADNAGNSIGKVNFKHYESQLAAARSRGDGKMTFNDMDGNSHEISLADAERQRGYLLKNNEDDYITQHVDGTVTTAGGNVDDILMTRIATANSLGGSADFTQNADGSLNKGRNRNISDRKSINEAIEHFTDYNNQLSRQNATNRANDRFSGEKK